MTYRIEFTKRADKQFQALPAQVQRRIEPKIGSLAQNPRPYGAIKLSGEDNVYRIRISDYRVVYNIEDENVLVLIFRVDHRRDVYKR